MSTVPRGRFVWYDLMTTDQEKAVEFYTKVVGWTTEDWPNAPTRYAMWKLAGGKTMGGCMTLPPEQVQRGTPPHWIGYIATPNVDDSAKQAAQLGGTILVPPDDIPTVGRFAVLSDPQGAVVAIFTPAGEAPGHEGAPELGECSWHELYTTDYGAALQFYSQLFGWEKGDAFDMGPEVGTYQLFKRNGRDVGGMMKKMQPEMPSAWTYYFRVANINDAAARVTASGGQIVSGPMEVPGGDMIVVATDPQGGMFALHQVGAASA